MCMPDKSRDARPEAIVDDDASLLWLVAKSSFLPKNRRKLLCRRITGSSKRITMCSTNIDTRTQTQLINSGRVQITYSEKHRLFNQMLGSRSPINNRNILWRSPWRHRTQRLAAVVRDESVILFNEKI